jgi:hypothetical protein
VARGEMESNKFVKVFVEQQDIIGFTPDMQVI